MEAGHGTEEFDTGDPLHRRVDGRKRIDHAYDDVVAIDVIPVARRVASRPHYANGHGLRRRQQRRRERSGEIRNLSLHGRELSLAALRTVPGSPAPSPLPVVGPTSQEFWR